MPIGFSVYGVYYLRVISYYVSFGHGLYRRIEDGVPEWGNGLSRDDFVDDIVSDNQISHRSYQYQSLTLFNWGGRCFGSGCTISLQNGGELCRTGG